MSETDSYDQLYKIVLSGDCGVGKSNILLRYMHNTFEETVPTIGVEFATKIITLPNSVRVKAQIWDTSGCEKYRSITTGHYRRAVGALLVYDVTNEESFEHLDFWLESLRDHGDEHIVVALVGNKCDIVESEPSRREVMAIKARHYAEKNSLLFLAETSACLNKNVREGMETLFAKIYEKQSELVVRGLRSPQQLKVQLEEEMQPAPHRCCY